MDIKYLQKLQYTLFLYNECTNRFQEKTKFELIFSMNGEKVSAETFLLDLKPDGVVCPKKFNFQSDTYPNLTSISFHDENSLEVFSKIRHTLYNVFRHDLVDYASGYKDLPFLLLDRLEYFLDSVDLTKASSNVSTKYLYHVKYLDSGLELPFIKLKGDEEFEVVSLLEQTDPQTQWYF